MTDPLADLARLEGVPSAVAAAIDAVDAVLRDRGQRQVPAETTARALLAGARASAAMEPEPHRSSSEPSLRSSSEPSLRSPSEPSLRPPSECSETRSWLPGSIRLSTELIDLAGSIRTTPAQVLARAHVLVARDLVDDEALGRTLTPDTARLHGLMGLLSAQTAAPPLVLAAIAHAELATLRPFGGGDGILARAVEHLVLIEAGVDPRAVLVPEAGHAAAGGAYDGALQRYAAGDVAGVRDWIVQCAQALTFGAESSPLGAARRFRKDGRV